MESILVDGDGFQNVVSLVQDGAGGGFVHAAALHADKTVLNDIQLANAILAADLVQVLNQGNTVHLLAVHSGGNALLKVDGNIGRGIRCLLRGNTQLQEAGLVVLRLQRGLFEVQTLVAQMPQVLVLGVVGLAVDLQGDVVSLGVVDLLVTALDVPLTPRSNDGHIGAQGLEGQLKTHLIIALAGAAVADGICTFLDGDIRQSLGDAGTCKAGAQQVVLVLCAELQGGEDVVLDEVLLQVEDVQLGSAGSLSLLFQTVQLSTLTHVAGDSDDFAVVVVLFQPGNDDGGIQTAGVSQNNLFNIFLFLFHKNCPLSKFYPPKRLNIYSFHVSYYTRPATNCNTAYCTRKFQLIETTLFYSLHFAA